MSVGGFRGFYRMQGPLTCWLVAVGVIGTVTSLLVVLSPIGVFVEDDPVRTECGGTFEVADHLTDPPPRAREDCLASASIRMAIAWFASTVALFSGLGAMYRMSFRGVDRTPWVTRMQPPAPPPPPPTPSGQ